MPDMGRGITAPAGSVNIINAAAEMQLLGSTTATAIDDLEAVTGVELAGKASTTYVDVQTDAARFTKGRPGDADAFTLPAGVHTISSAANADRVSNLPEQTSGQLVVFTNAGETTKSVWFLPYNRTYFWTTVTRNSTGAMAPWQKWGDTSGQVIPYPQHTIRQAAMMHAMGGPIDTGGLGAAAFRVDHGFANFKAKLLPLFQAAGIVPMITYNPRDWDRPENAGVTASEVNGWVADGLVEISNHTATHSDATGTEAVYDAIVTSLAEIEAQLPAAAGQVWGFCVPGVGGTGFDGFGSGSTPEQWDTYAGRLILQHHAVGFGALSGTELRDLDGTIRDGLRHITMDSASVSALKSRVDQAVDQRRGAQFMVHPSLIDTEGYLTTAQFGQVLDYIVARRDAGELVPMSCYQMMVADATVIASGLDADSALAAFEAGLTA